MNKEQTIQTYRFISQRYALDRFEDAALEDLLKYYKTAKKKVQKDIKAAIAKGLNYPSQRRLHSLYKEIDQLILTLTDKISKPVVEAVGEAGVYSYKNTNAIMSWDNKVDGYNNVALSSNQIASLVSVEELGGDTVDGWLWNALNSENKALKSEISAARIRGVSYKKLMSELGDKYNDLFTGNRVQDNLETVVKSYIQTVNSKAHKDIYEANRNIIKEVEWSAILENGNVSSGKGTCPRCMALDGQTFSSVANGPSCPLHPRCRCMYLPVTLTWEDLDLDVEEMDKAYNKWYERSPSRKRLAYGLTDKNFARFWKDKLPYWQDNAIGPVRANLIRDGVVKFQDIVYKNGNLIPLKKLVGVEQLAEARKHRGNK